MIPANYDRVADLILEATDEALGHTSWDRTNPITRGRIAADTMQALVINEGMERYSIEELIADAMARSEARQQMAGSMAFAASEAR